MESRFTSEQEATIRRVLDVSVEGQQAFSPGKSKVDISVLQRALGLPPIPYSQFLGPDCWLAGGGVLRWLCSVGEARESDRGDFDFFFPSLDALNATARRMLAQGFTVEGYRFAAQTRAEFLSGSFNRDRRSEIWGADGQLAPLTAELVNRLRLSYLELRSPSGDAVQLVASCFATPLKTVLSFDLSICQFAVDHCHFSFGPWAMSDLLHNRWRLVNLMWPRATFLRMFRYARRGFRPYVGSALRLSAAFAAFKIAGVWKRVELFLASKKNFELSRGQA